MFGEEFTIKALYFSLGPERSYRLVPSLGNYTIGYGLFVRVK